MKTARRFIGLILFVLIVSGCVSTGTAPKKSQVDPDLLAMYIEQGKTFEAEGLLSSALEQYTLALTLDPAFDEAIERKGNVEKKLSEAAEAHYQAGLAFDNEGKYDLARKEYLAALQNWPGHDGAKHKMTAGGVQDDANSIVHIIAPGESISKIAKLYYGDYKKYPLIADYNNMEDPTKIKIGQSVKIPSIEGVSLDELKAIQKKYLKTESSAYPEPEKQGETSIKPEGKSADHEKADRKPAPSEVKEQMPESKGETSAEISAKPTTEMQPAETLPAEEKIEKPLFEGPEATGDNVKATPASGTTSSQEPSTHPDDVAQILDKGNAFYANKQYEKAIAAFEKVLESDPSNVKASNALFDSHFQQGLLLFNTGDYLGAKDNFESAYFYNDDCDKCPEYVDQCLEMYKEKHYTMGIHHFRKEQLGEAITEWKKVEAIDPGYKDLSMNLKKAELLYDRLESIKKGKTQ